ncbi:hypothetical protein ACWERI_12975 [Streptomyces collinus]
MGQHLRHVPAVQVQRGHPHQAGGRDGHAKGPGVLAQAGLEGHSAAYWWSAAVFVAGLVATVLLYRRGVPQQDENAASVVHM